MPPQATQWDGETSDRIVISRCNCLPGVEFKSISRAQRLWRVLHEKYALVSPITGVTARMFRGQIVSTQPGELMLYEPGDFDANTYIAPDSQFHVLSIAAPVLEPALAEAVGQYNWRFRTPTIRSPSLSDAIDTLGSAMHAGASELEAESAFFMLISQLAEQHVTSQARKCGAAATGEPRALARLRAVLHANLGEPPSLDELAGEVGLNKFRVLRIFKAHFGTTPYAYRQALRMARAREMLRHDKRPSEVGALLGFADFSHFRRTFVKYVGLSPSSFRRALAP